MKDKKSITVKATVKLPIKEVWKLWTTPEDITQWNFASDDWCAPSAVNDLNVEGAFSYRMESKDGEMGFDFRGNYTKVEPFTLIEYEIEDGRKVSISFSENNDETLVTETFELEDQNPAEMQKNGWQAILDNFKAYAEEGSLTESESKTRHK
ncbi:MAG: SRPBCC family protein [Cyclobacteriaceae bacterium]